jgi:peptidyl-dipeptidase A
MLALGKSKTWQEAISILSDGQMHSLEAKPLLDYFDPLLNWLKTANKGKTCGWKERRRVF